MSRNRNVKSKKKNKGLKIGLLVVLGLILFVVGFGYAYVHNLLNSTNQDVISKTDEDLGIKAPSAGTSVETSAEASKYYYDQVTGVTNIALFGVDAEMGKNGRSDTIMIVTVDKNTKKIKLTSIVRDSYVNIPDRGMDKINHAYAFGGAQLALKTINSNFNLDIRNYATVNFTTLPKIIDSIGGVKIKVTNAEATQIAGLSSGGTYNLTGAQALDYSRIRYIDSDFARSGRQRTVIEAIINKMLNSSVTTYPSILAKVLPMITTNMSSNDILGLATTVVTSGTRTIEQNRFPQDSQAAGKMIKGVYYYVFEKQPTLDAMGRYIYLDEATN